MGYNIVLTGATGMVGKGVLLECIDSDMIETVLLVNRSMVGIQHPKVKEVLINNFFDLSEIETELENHDACFFCLGITSIGQSEEAYSSITYDLTLHFAKTFLKQNKESIFCYVSGTGTDSSEKGRSMWARVKGRTENALLNMPFKAAYMFRPGYIQPLRGITSKTQWYAAVYALFKPVYLILKQFPGAATNTTNMGLAMINILDGKHKKHILENKDINELSKS
jgi:nucleoside-diphosphate-sugar epimerase